MENHKCNHCGNEFGSEDALQMHMNAKHTHTERKSLSKSFVKKLKIYGILAVILAIILTGTLMLANKKSLPPTTMAGHIEVLPDSKILTKKMDMRIHKHILEHYDGEDGSRGGIIINYDCKTHECDSGLIQKLQDFTKTYEYVYVAPYKNMKSKIAVTKLNRQITLDEFSPETIDQFLK